MNRDTDFEGTFEVTDTQTEYAWRIIEDFQCGHCGFGYKAEEIVLNSEPICAVVPRVAVHRRVSYGDWTE